MPGENPLNEAILVMAPVAPAASMPVPFAGFVSRNIDASGQDDRPKSHEEYFRRIEHDGTLLC
jgi:hypothetical protein